MKKLLLLWLIIIFGFLFLFIPRIGPEDYFLFSDMKLYFATHVYFIFERVCFIIFAWIIYNESTEYTDELKVFFFIMIADLVDYLLTYSQPWFYYNDIPITFNMVKVLVFSYLVAKALIKSVWSI